MPTRRSAMLTLAAGASALVVRPVLAKGNLASNPVRLPELKIDTVNLKYSVTDYELETGKYYFWTISCDDAEEGIQVMAPELFQNSWINQIVANDMVTHTTSLYSIEFGAAGTIQIQFMPIRPGAYAFYSPGFENKGLKGKIIVN
ncbi:MAG: hypothetical protein JWN11_2302 [Hyphomicrobiales bacterium]|nr:hypothetical protein [Hyphomicrobiales bacterium]